MAPDLDRSPSFEVNFVKIESMEASSADLKAESVFSEAHPLF
jgi:hypothetical protein